MGGSCCKKKKGGGAAKGDVANAVVAGGTGRGPVLAQPAGAGVEAAGAAVKAEAKAELGAGKETGKAAAQEDPDVQVDKATGAKKKRLLPTRDRSCQIDIASVMSVAPGAAPAVATVAKSAEPASPLLRPVQKTSNGDCKKDSGGDSKKDSGSGSGQPPLAPSSLLPAPAGQDSIRASVADASGLRPADKSVVDKPPITLILSHGKSRARATPPSVASAASPAAAASPSPPTSAGHSQLTQPPSRTDAHD